MNLIGSYIYYVKFVVYSLFHVDSLFYWKFVLVASYFYILCIYSLSLLWIISWHAFIQTLNICGFYTPGPSFSLEFGSNLVFCWFFLPFGNHFISLFLKWCSKRKNGCLLFISLYINMMASSKILATMYISSKTQRCTLSQKQSGLFCFNAPRFCSFGVAFDAEGKMNMDTWEQMH